MKLFIFFTARWRAVLLAAGALGLLSACSYTNGYEPPTPCNIPQSVSYEHDVLPILKENCRDACHNPKDYAALTGGTLNMDDFSQVHYYSTTGHGGVSFMVGNIRHDAGFVAMPYSGGKLDDCQIATIKAWVDAGALQN